MECFVCFQSSGETSPASLTPAGTPALGAHAPKYGTVIPNRIFVGGIAANVSRLWDRFLLSKKNVRVCVPEADRLCEIRTEEHCHV